jgi:type II secretory pathway component GspD/PulD (secretin)
VSIADGGTIILGGLRQRSRSEFTNGVPALSRLPVLGGLFRQRRKERSEQEIILLLRPAIKALNDDQPPTLPLVYDESQRRFEERDLGRPAQSVELPLVQSGTAVDVEGPHPTPLQAP